MEVTHELTFTYRDDADLVAQLMTKVNELTQIDGMEPYAAIRIRYPHLSSSCLTMRLKRHPYFFPKRMGPKGGRILELKVTDALHRDLSRKHSNSRAAK